jgi:hypothetical protein
MGYFLFFGCFRHFAECLRNPCLQCFPLRFVRQDAFAMDLSSPFLENGAPIGPACYFRRFFKIRRMQAWNEPFRPARRATREQVFAARANFAFCPAI